MSAREERQRELWRTHLVMRAAEQEFGRAMVTYAAAIPPIRRISGEDDFGTPARKRLFFLLEDGRRFGFEISALTMMDLPPQLRGMARLTAALRQLWDGMRLRWQEPPRVRESRQRFDGIAWVDEPGVLTNGAIRTAVEQMRVAQEAMARVSGLAGGDMTTNAAPPEPLPALAAEELALQMSARQAQARQQELIREYHRRAELDYRRQIELEQVRRAQERYARYGARGLECDCGECRQRRRQHERRADPAQRRREEFRQIEDSYRMVATNRLREPSAEETRSLSLLKEWLSPDQLVQYETNKYFDVKGSAGTRYRIYYQSVSNVIELDGEGIGLRGWCFGPEGGPARFTGDVMLTQKLALETDEPGAIRVANRFWGQASEAEVAERQRQEALWEMNEQRVEQQRAQAAAMRQQGMGRPGGVTWF